MFLFLCYFSVFRCTSAHKAGVGIKTLCADNCILYEFGLYYICMHDWASVKARVREALSSYIYRRTKRSPMILPILLEV